MKRRRSYAVKVHWPYVLTEGFFVVYQLGWAVVFATSGFVLCALGAVYVASCVVYSPSSMATTPGRSASPSTGAG